MCSFIERAGEICKPDYVPDIKDVLKVRVRTSGIVEEEYIIDGVTFVCVVEPTSAAVLSVQSGHLPLPHHPPQDGRRGWSAQ